MKPSDIVSRIPCLTCAVQVYLHLLVEFDADQLPVWTVPLILSNTQRSVVSNTQNIASERDSKHENELVSLYCCAS